MDQIEYSGRDNLEVMQEAKNYNYFLLKLILSQVQHNTRTVDFGAGNGTFSIPVAAAGNDLICVETDLFLYNSLSNHGLKVLRNLDSLTDDSVDYIYALNVLEHIEEDDAIIELWLKKLRPSGRLLVYVPAFDILFSSMDRKVGHVRRYTKKMLIAKLKRAGFAISEVKYADSIGYLATLIYKVCDNGEGAVNLHMLRFYDRWIFPVSRMFDLITFPFFGKNVYACAVKRP